MLASQFASSAQLEQPLRPAQVPFQHPVQRGLQRCQRQSENRRADQDKDRRSRGVNVPGPGQRLKPAQPGHDDNTEDQQVDQAGHKPADQQRARSAERSGEYPAHSSPARRPPNTRSTRRNHGSRTSSWGPPPRPRPLIPRKCGPGGAGEVGGPYALKAGPGSCGAGSSYALKAGPGSCGAAGAGSSYALKAAQIAAAPLAPVRRTRRRPPRQGACVRRRVFIVWPVRRLRSVLPALARIRVSHLDPTPNVCIKSI